jgi:hypothetical protein
MVSLRFTPGDRATSYSTYCMDLSQKKTFTPRRSDVTEPAERRRVARIVHDDRGNASVKWQDAPANYKRRVLELQSDEDRAGELSLEVGPQGFDPYSRTRLPEPQRKTTAAAPRTDLRKLSEWIKMMREREELKAKGKVG